MNESRLILMSHVSYEWVSRVWLSHIPYDWVISHATAVWYGDAQNGQDRGCESRGIPTDYVQHSRSGWVMSRMNESFLTRLQFDTGTIKMAKFVGVNPEELPQTMSNTAEVNQSCVVWMSHVSHDCSLIRRRLKWPSSWVWIQRKSHRLCLTLQKWLSQVSYEGVMSRMNAVWDGDAWNGQVRGCKSRGTLTDYVQYSRSDWVMCGMNESYLAWLQFDTETLKTARFVG